MPVLDCPGVFTMLLPDGWRATGAEGTFYELTKEGEEGAVHLSVSGRDGTALGESEAGDLVGRFVGRIRCTESVEIRVLRESEEQHRAVTRCVTPDEVSGDPVSWLVFVVLWLTTALVCSCAAPPGSGMLDEAETMFASIFPPGE